MSELTKVDRCPDCLSDNPAIHLCNCGLSPEPHPAERTGRVCTNIWHSSPVPEGTAKIEIPGEDEVNFELELAASADKLIRVIERAREKMTDEELEKADAYLDSLSPRGREDEADKVSERQRPSKPLNAGSNPAGDSTLLEQPWEDNAPHEMPSAQGEPERCETCGGTKDSPSVWHGDSPPHAWSEFCPTAYHTCAEPFHKHAAQPSPVVQTPISEGSFVMPPECCIKTQEMFKGEARWCMSCGKDLTAPPSSVVAPVVPVEETKRDAGEATLSWRHGVHDFTITTTSAYLCEKLDEIASEAFAKFTALPATEKEN